jgi:hypothetical protein
VSSRVLPVGILHSRRSATLCVGLRRKEGSFICPTQHFPPRAQAHLGRVLRFALRAQSGLKPRPSFATRLTALFIAMLAISIGKQKDTSALKRAKEQSFR